MITVKRKDAREANENHARAAQGREGHANSPGSAKVLSLIVARVDGIAPAFDRGYFNCGIVVDALRIC